MSEPVDSSTAMGKFLLTQLGGIAELEKSTILERARLGTLRAVNEGKWVGGRAPLGYKVVHSRLEIVPEEAALVREIFDLCVKDRMTAYAIADLMNARGIPLPQEIHSPMSGKPTARGGR